MRGLLTVLIAASALAEEPQTVRQGDTIRISAVPLAERARMGSRTIRLFHHDGKATGLMPVEVNQTPGTQHLEILDADGRVIDRKTIHIEHVPFPEQNIIISRAKKQIKPSPLEMETVAALRNAVTPERFWSEPFTRPVAGCMNSPFGVRRLHNSEPTGNYHRGLDQRSKRGTPVRAITGGVVRIVRMFNLHGGTVGIDHGEGVTSFYLHLSRFHVKEGARVRGGDVVGYAGSTGFATGPHLHWQLTVNGVPVNPHQWVEGIAPCPEKAAPRKTTRPKERVRQ